MARPVLGVMSCASTCTKRRLGVKRPVFSGGSYLCEGATTTTRNKFSSGVRERAVRMVGEHRADYGSECAAMTSIAGKIGCTAALAANVRDRLKLLERELKELRWANEILTIAQRVPSVTTRSRS